MSTEDETMFLCGYKRLPRYGTTGEGSSSRSISSKPLYNHILRHKVSKDDSLQSIALKYNSSVTEIKRINKLWSNDSIYLRDELKVPVILTKPDESQQQNFPVVNNGQIGSSVLSDTSDFSVVNKTDFVPPCYARSTSLGNNTCRNRQSDASSLDAYSIKSAGDDEQASSSATVICKTVYDKSNEAFSDIFHRIDSTLKITANNVHRLETQSTIDKLLPVTNDHDAYICDDASPRHHRNAPFLDFSFSSPRINNSRVPLRQTDVVAEMRVISGTQANNNIGCNAAAEKIARPKHRGKKRIGIEPKNQEFVPMNDITTRQV